MGIMVEVPSWLILGRKMCVHYINEVLDLIIRHRHAGRTLMHNVIDRFQKAAGPRGLAR